MDRDAGHPIAALEMLRATDPHEMNALPVDVSRCVSVVMVSYNTAGLTLESIRSILSQAGETVAEIVVVDNASTDGSVERIRSEFPDVVIVESAGNVGFAAAVNRGAEVAAGRFLLLINPDTVLHDDAPRTLAVWAESEPEIGLYGGLTLHPDGTVNPYSAVGLPTLWGYLTFALGLSALFPNVRLFNPEAPITWAGERTKEVGAVSGCLLLVSRGVWRELGGMDERYFMYCEDTDLSIRARERGYRPSVSRDVVITHIGGASSTDPGGKRVLLLTGKATLARDRFGRTGSWVARSGLVVGVALRAAVHGLAAVVGSGADRSWREALRRRAEWFSGYP